MWLLCEKGSMGCCFTLLYDLGKVQNKIRHTYLISSGKEVSGTAQAVLLFSLSRMHFSLWSQISNYCISAMMNSQSEAQGKARICLPKTYCHWHLIIFLKLEIGAGEWEWIVSGAFLCCINPAFPLTSRWGKWTSLELQSRFLRMQG